MSSRTANRAALGAAAALLGALFACARDDGPAPVAWDRTRCAHCGMLVSRPAWGAQLRTADGVVRIFDDPGCLLVELDDADAPAAIWFHHHREDRWIPGDAVRFVESSGSPMDYGLAALDRGEAPEGLTLEAARARALAFDRARSAR